MSHINELTAELLHDWPLPSLEHTGDKDARGSVLIIGGSVQMPGAIILAATAALRAGAGRLRIATCRSIAAAVGVTIPEARVFGLPETDAGAIDPSAVDQLAQLAKPVSATLIGPGMIDDEAVQALSEPLLRQLAGATLVLDAAVLTTAARDPQLIASLGGNVMLTPHAGETATMLDMHKDAVEEAPEDTVQQAAQQMQAVVALKGAQTRIANPAGALYCYAGGGVGLATSGSGDTLAGVVAGLAARGAEPTQALCWGVYLHGEAGKRLAQRWGQVGFLARELVDEVPLLVKELMQSEEKD